MSITSFLPSSFYLISIIWIEDNDNRLANELNVIKEMPVLDIVQIELHHFFKADAAPY